MKQKLIHLSLLTPLGWVTTSHFHLLLYYQSYSSFNCSLGEYLLCFASMYSVPSMVLQFHRKAYKILSLKNLNAFWFDLSWQNTERCCQGNISVAVNFPWTCETLLWPEDKCMLFHKSLPRNRGICIPASLIPSLTIHNTFLTETHPVPLPYWQSVAIYGYIFHSAYICHISNGL